MPQPLQTQPLEDPTMDDQTNEMSSPTQSPNQTARKPKRIGIEKLRHNASERRRKLLFNTKLEELRGLVPNLPSSCSKRKVVEGAVDLLRQLLSEREYYRQLVNNMEHRTKAALFQQLQQRQKPPSLSRPPPPSSCKETLPPLRCVLRLESPHVWALTRSASTGVPSLPHQTDFLPYSWHRQQPSVE
ncbi:hypothetical protein QOT17_004956 [Balamuthia mandrillaris]